MQVVHLGDPRWQEGVGAVMACFELDTPLDPLQGVPQKEGGRGTGPAPVAPVRVAPKLERLSPFPGLNEF